jgi:hypothetical protein
LVGGIRLQFYKHEINKLRGQIEELRQNEAKIISNARKWKTTALEYDEKLKLLNKKQNLQPQQQPTEQSHRQSGKLRLFFFFELAVNFLFFKLR